MIMIGETISTTQSEIFKKVLTHKDFLDLHEKFGYTISTMKSLMYRQRNVTEDNIEIVSKLSSKCLEKAEDATIYFEKIKSDLNMFIPKS